MPYTSRTVGIYTLGCKVNQYESEAIAERFRADGFTVKQATEVCDVYVINTCTVTAESDRKACQLIRRAVHRNPNAYVLVTGCFSQTQPQRAASIEGVDYICGNAEKLSVVTAAERLIDEGKKSVPPETVQKAPDENGFEAMRIGQFDRTRAYVKIEDGCESHCTYCIIPAARGKIRSKPPQEVLSEVLALTDAGCREIVLTGIETASYGKDLEGYGLADLLCEIDRIPGIGRVRLGSLDPSIMKDSFVKRIASLKSLAPHFHLSMQSGSDRILALMKRKYCAKMALEGMERLRKAIPGVRFTTDMIVGFPQETDEDFEETLQFTQKAQFLMIHVFPYSRRAGTPAAVLSGQVPEAVKRRRAELLSTEESKIRQNLLNAVTDQTVSVLFETYENGMAYGHTPDFLEVAAPSPFSLHAKTLQVTIRRNDGTVCCGSISDPDYDSILR